VSQTSSNVACVVPKYKVTFDMALPAAAASNEVFDLKGFLAACATAGKCSDPGTTYIKQSDAAANYSVATDPGTVYIEYSKDADGVLHPGLTATGKSAINDLGYYAKGFGDPTLPALPILVTDDQTIGSGTNAAAPIFNGGGYSVAGQTVPLQQGHIY